MKSIDVLNKNKINYKQNLNTLVKNILFIN